MKFIMIFITSLIFLASSAAVASASTMDLTTPWGSTNGNSYPGYLVDGYWVQYSFPRISVDYVNLDAYTGTNSYSGPCSSYLTWGTCYPDDPTAYFEGIPNGSEVRFAVDLYNYYNNAQLTDRLAYTLYKVDSCPGSDVNSPSLTEETLFNCSETASYTNQTLVEDSGGFLEEINLYPYSESGISGGLALYDPGYYQINYYSENYNNYFSTTTPFVSLFFRVQKIILKGRVTNTITGQGIPNLTIRNFITGNPEPTLTTTDSDGYYNFPGFLPNDDFDIFPDSPSGYISNGPIYYVCQTAGTYKSPDRCFGDPGQDLPSDNAYDFAYTPINISSCESYDIPTSIVAGATYNATVTMKNTGGTTWDSGGSNPYRLGSVWWPNNTVWRSNNRVELPSSPVNPGETVSFAFEIIAPTTPGLYNGSDVPHSTSNWGMIQEGIDFFGPACGPFSIQVLPITINFSGKIWLDNNENKIKDSGETCFDSPTNGNLTLTAITNSTVSASIPTCASDPLRNDPYQLSITANPPTNISLTITVPSYYKSTGWNEGNFATPSAQSGGQENSYTLTVDSSQSTLNREINFGLKRDDAWFQINKGDLGSVGLIKPNSPSSTPFNLDPETILITEDPTVDITFAAPVPRVVTSYVGSLDNPPRLDYNYYTALANRIGNTQTFTTPNTPPISSGTYFYEGDLNLDPAWNIPNGVKATILVHGNLNINQNVTVPIGSSLALIASGNMIVAGNVDTVEGIYIIDGSIDTGISSTPLSAGGVFITWTDFLLSRNLEEINPTAPGEQFIFRPDLLINAPSLLENVPYSWGERLP